MEKKFTCAILLSVAVVISLLAACGPKPAGGPAKAPAEEEAMAWESHFGFMPAALGRDRARAGPVSLIPP